MRKNRHSLLQSICICMILHVCKISDLHPWRSLCQYRWPTRARRHPTASKSMSDHKAKLANSVGILGLTNHRMEKHRSNENASRTRQNAPAMCKGHRGQRRSMSLPTALDQKAEWHIHGILYLRGLWNWDIFHYCAFQNFARPLYLSRSPFSNKQPAQWVNDFHIF